MNNNDETKRTLRVASVQMESLPGDKEANFRKIEELVEQAARQHVRMIVFPECCITGYWFIRNLSVRELGELAEPVFDGPSSRRLIDLAKRFGMTIGAGLVEAGSSGEFHNSYVAAMADGRVQRHRKLHAFEHPSIRSGSEYTVFDIPEGFRVGVLICYVPIWMPDCWPTAPVAVGSALAGRNSTNPSRCRPDSSAIRAR